jgi:hypothetical protein
MAPKREKPVDGKRASRPLVADWLVANPGVALTLCGILLYGAVKFEFFLFYTRLGVDPDEVGLGYAEVLSRSVLALFVFIPLPLLVLWFTGVLARDADSSARRTGIWVAVGVAVLVVAYGAWFSVSAARAVEDGKGVSPELCNVLGLRAEVVSVTWVGSVLEGKKRPPAYTATYIGAANGLTILYDSDDGSKIIVASSDVSLQTIPFFEAHHRGGLLADLLGCL